MLNNTKSIAVKTLFLDLGGNGEFSMDCRIITTILNWKYTGYEIKQIATSIRIENTLLREYSRVTNWYQSHAIKVYCAYIIMPGQIRYQVITRISTWTGFGGKITCLDVRAYKGFNTVFREVKVQNVSLSKSQILIHKYSLQRFVLYVFPRTGSPIKFMKPDRSSIVGKT